MTQKLPPPALPEKDSSTGLAEPPPIYHLAGTAAKREGNHFHHVWLGRVVHEQIAGESLPMIVKLLDSEITAAIELSCALAARELRLPVPRPGLVVAERSLLPGVPDSVKGEVLLLVGSHYQRPDAFMASVTASGGEAAEDHIWRTLCESSTGAPAAAFDELVANADRHCENVLFDGAQWWLFDHDAALPPASQYVVSPDLKERRLEAIAFMAKVNQIAREMLRRRPKDHSILAQPTQFDSRSKAVRALAIRAESWTHPDPHLEAIFRLTSVVLGLIHLRLPALAEQLHARLGSSNPPGLQWSSPTTA
jgi:hypothetical protein